MALKLPICLPPCSEGCSECLEFVVLQDKEEAEEEARVAIRQIVIPNNQPIELRPRVPDVVEHQ
eukprot:scaffold365535_cov22-Prasinocladus_malaysianus.AAC.1